MIVFLNKEQKKASRSLWETVFPEDSAAFLDEYYAHIAPDNLLPAELSRGEIVSMAHYNPLSLWCRGIIVSSYYISAVATKPSARLKGIMRRVMTAGLKAVGEARLPFVFLLPADDGYYRGLGFADMERPENRGLIPSEANIVRSQSGLEKEYEVFCLRDDAYARRMRGILSSDPEENPPEAPSLLSRMGRVTDPAAFGALLRSRKKLSLLFRYLDPLLPEKSGLYRLDCGPDTAFCRQILPDDAVPQNIPQLGPEALFSLLFSAGPDIALPGDFSAFLPCTKTFFCEDI